MVCLLLWVHSTFVLATVLTKVVFLPSVGALPPPIRPASESLQEGDDMELFSLPPITVTKADVEPTTKNEPYKIALPNDVSITPLANGSWDELSDGTKVWRLRVEAPGATGAIVGFTRYTMPEGGKLYIYSSDKSFWLPPFTSAHNNPTRELWLPLIPTNDFVIEVNLPPSLNVRKLKLKIGAINSGFRSIPVPRRDLQARDLESGSCNNDVVCPVGDDWQQEIRAVAGYSFTEDPNEGSLYCTGTMMNNVLQDKKNYFLTAHHCLNRRRYARRMTVYWNFNTSVCGGSPDGELTDYTTGGAQLIATYEGSDFTLVELNESPDPSSGVTYAGWDRTGVDATSSVGIHHPSGSEKRISFEDDPTITTARFGYSNKPNGDFVRVIDWDSGTTEPGSSGSPLFNQDHKVIGQLYGGSAACGNDFSDWYGKFSASWEGGGTPETRLSDWLDPGKSNVATLDTLDDNNESPISTPTEPPTASPTEPTASPTSSPTLGLSCTNNPDWYFENKRGKRRDCSWVISSGVRSVRKRCRKNGFDGDDNNPMKAEDGCPLYCNPACQT